MDSVPVIAPKVPGKSLFPRAQESGAALICLLLLSSCSTPPSEKYGAAAVSLASPLLQEARSVTKEDGLPAASRYVSAGLASVDESHGAMERRAIETTRSPDTILSDSLAGLSKQERRRIAIIMIPGTEIGFGKPSKTRETLRNATTMAGEMGFSAHFIDTPSRGTVAENSVLVGEQIQPILKEVDHVILVMLSKGAHDLISYLQGEGMGLPGDQRAKVKAVLSLVGTVQGSVVADYFANAPFPLPTAMRMLLIVGGKKSQVAMLKKVGASPWEPASTALMRPAYPNLTWVSIAMVPDGEDGEIVENLWSPFIRKRISKTSPYYSPMDGLVETAAAILPVEVEFTEWIVRAYGSHSLPNGRYAKGNGVAPFTTDPEEMELNPESGGEVMSAYLRALPTSLLH